MKLITQAIFMKYVNSMSKINAHFKKYGFNQNEINEIINYSLSADFDKKSFSNLMNKISARAKNSINSLNDINQYNSLIEDLGMMRSISLMASVQILQYQTPITHNFSVSNLSPVKKPLLYLSITVLSPSAFKKIGKLLTEYSKINFPLTLPSFFDPLQFSANVNLISWFYWLKLNKIESLIKDSITAQNFGNFINHVNKSIGTVYFKNKRRNVNQFIDYLARVRACYLNQSVSYKLPYFNNKKTIRTVSSSFKETAHWRIVKNDLSDAVNKYAVGYEEYLVRLIKMKLSQIGDDLMSQLKFTESQIRQFFDILINPALSQKQFDNAMIPVLNHPLFLAISVNKQSGLVESISNVRSAVINGQSVSLKGFSAHVFNLSSSLTGQIVSKRLKKYVAQLLPTKLDKFLTFLYRWILTPEEYIGLSNSTFQAFNTIVDKNIKSLKRCKVLGGIFVPLITLIALGSCGAAIGAGAIAGIAAGTSIATSIVEDVVFTGVVSAVAAAPVATAASTALSTSAIFGISSGVAVGCGAIIGGVTASQILKEFDDAENHEFNFTLSKMFPENLTVESMVLILSEATADDNGIKLMIRSIYPNDTAQQLEERFLRLDEDERLQIIELIKEANKSKNIMTVNRNYYDRWAARQSRLDSIQTSSSCTLFRPSDVDNNPDCLCAREADFASGTEFRHS